MAKLSPIALEEEKSFYFFVFPWVIGFLIFTVGPMLTSVVLSLMDWDIITAPRWIGLSNYRELFSRDPVFWKSLRVTAIYACVTVPLHLTSSLLVAILLNQNVKGLGVFRTIFYLPTVLPPVASIMLWIWIFFPDGLLNAFVTLLSMPPQNWLQDERLALPSIMLMSLWGFGASMLIFLAGLQSIPIQLYEAADIDGAGRWSKFRHITLPMLSPVIFFNLVTGIIGTFQVFAAGYLFTGGGPNNATMFYVLYLYKNAFEYFRMGYACALAWVLFVIIMTCTLLVVKSSTRWVYYEGAR